MQTKKALLTILLKLDNILYSDYMFYTLCFRCVVCFLLSMKSHYYKTCHGTYLSKIHVFGFDVIFVILKGCCLMLSLFLCVYVLHFDVVSLFSYI